MARKQRAKHLWLVMSGLFLLAGVLGVVSVRRGSSGTRVPNVPIAPPPPEFRVSRTAEHRFDTEGEFLTAWLITIPSGEQWFDSGINLRPGNEVLFNYEGNIAPAVFQYYVATDPKGNGGNLFSLKPSMKPASQPWLVKISDKPEFSEGYEVVRPFGSMRFRAFAQVVVLRVEVWKLLTLSVTRVTHSSERCKGGYDAYDDSYRVFLPKTSEWVDTGIPVLGDDRITIQNSQDDVVDVWQTMIAGSVYPATRQEAALGGSDWYWNQLHLDESRADFVDTIRLRFEGRAKSLLLNVSVVHDHEVCMNSWMAHDFLCPNVRCTSAHMAMHATAAKKAADLISKMPLAQ